MPKLLLLGGSGFLGRHLLRSLRNDAETFAVVRSPRGAEKIRAASPATRIVTIEEASSLRFDRIFNLVADYGRGGAPLARLLGPNLLYPLEMLEAVEGEAVLNVSTALPPNYSNYARSKKLLEQALTHLEERTGRRFINVHLHNMYGPGGEPAELVGFVIARMLAGSPVEVSDGRNSRDFIFVDDAVAALNVLSTGADALSPGAPVEVGSGRSVRLRDVVLLLGELTGSTSELRFGAKPGNPFEPDRLAADVGPLRRLGWAPHHPLREGLKATVAAALRGARSGNAHAAGKDAEPACASTSARRNNG